MTNRELIARLKQNEPDAEARVLVRVHTQRYTVAEVTPFDADHRGVWISLPENMHVVARKSETRAPRRGRGQRGT